MFRQWSGRRVGVAAAVVAGVLAVPAVAGFSGIGALVGLDEGTPTNVALDSTRHVTTTSRVDLEDAPARECGVPATEPAVVDETAVDVEPTVVEEVSIGPATVYYGPDQSLVYQVLAGGTAVNSIIVYERQVTQYFQATAAGEACTVVAAAARFTG